MTEALNTRHAVYVGSFDPLTLGHENIVRRGSTIFDQLTVGIGVNPEKAALFAPEDRLELTRRVLSPIVNVDVRTFHGLAVDFVRECGAAVMLRGVRSLTDIESEFTMSLANSVLAPDVETVFLMSDEKYTHISSTLIKQIAQMGREDSARQLGEFVPREIIEPLLARYPSRPDR